MLNIESRERNGGEWTNWIPEGDLFAAMAIRQLIQALDDSSTSCVETITIRWMDGDKTQFGLDHQRDTNDG